MLANSPANFVATRQFIARVLAWPQEGDEPAYGNLHWTSKRDGYDRPFWNGRACVDVEDFVSTLDWVRGQADVQDIYLCTSTQRTFEERVSRAGRSYRNAIRNQQNAVKLKALFLDIDFKAYEGGACEAIDALSAFVASSGMPQPTAGVLSGGGIHVYWTLMRALTRAEWEPLAYALAEATKQHGLKCDTQCTIDSARLLRVPGTLNRKYEPPVPVRLAGGKVLDFDYANERIERVLEPYMGTAPRPAAPVFNLPPRPPLQQPDELGAGIETGAPLVDIDEVAQECPFIHKALTTGGKDYTNPLWNLTTLIATFTKGERADAHLMAAGHDDYTQESTDELFDRKLREKAEKGLGWPQCSTISATGCTLCQSCPHLAKGRSPLATLLRKVTDRDEAPPFADPYADFVGPAFPLSILPPVLRDFVDAQHRAMGADPSALAMAALTAVASALNAESTVRMGDGWRERPVLWTALIGKPSAMKSPIIEKLVKPLRKDRRRSGCGMARPAGGMEASRRGYKKWTGTGSS
jgi:hypothetical protein